MAYPTIEFKIDKRQDKQKLFWMATNPLMLDGRNRFELATKRLPSIKNLTAKKDKKRIRRIISRAVDMAYKKEIGLMRERLKEIKKEWEKISTHYFKTASKVFDNHRWPKGRYTAFVTILSIFPRDIKNKTFQVPYSSTDFAISITIHETLHFLFYDYFNNKFKGKLNEKSLWELSEIVDEILMKRQNLSKFVNRQPNNYPTLGDKRIYLEKIYNKTRDMGEFIQKAILFVK